MRKKKTKFKDAVLDGKAVMAKVTKGMAYMNRLNCLECYAMFMGKVQLIEFALQRMLVDKYKYDYDDVEKFTLGQAIAELKRLGLRKDFISKLEGLNKQRIYLAHHLLADNIVGKRLIGAKYTRLSWKPLRYALYRVEETILIYDFLSSNKYL